MSNYRRPRRSGATIFFTVTLADRSSDLLTRRIDLLRCAVARVKASRPFDINAWVVLPDHMHCIWTLPQGDTDYSTRWSLIKANFSRQIPMRPSRASHIKRREKGVWQRRFWEHHIRNDADFKQHLAYCWSNPVKHGLVDDPGDWPHSSYHRDVGRVDSEVRMDAHPTVAITASAAPHPTVWSCRSGSRIPR